MAHPSKVKDHGHASRTPASSQRGGGDFFAAIQAKREPISDANRNGGFFQPKLTVHPADDPYEREADAVAAQVVGQLDGPQATAESGQVVSATSPAIQPKISPLPPSTTADSGRDTPVKEHAGEDLASEERTRHAVQRKAAFDNPGDLDQDNGAPNGGFLQGKAETGGMRVPSPSFEGRLQSSKGGGQSLGGDVKQSMEGGFGADFGGVRIHTGETANTLNREVSAQAFTHGRDIYFRRGAYQPENRAGKQLLAHELTHVVQQGQAQPQGVQRKPQAPAVAQVQQQTSPSIQRLGISDALDYFADMAANIPGFTMLTFLLGVNPINFRSVDRTALNLFRALIGFMPGGELIFQALQNHGILTDIATWAQEKLAIFSDIGTEIKDGVDSFLDSLGWRDIFDLGDVWRRAKRIFTGPIGRLIDFVAGLVSDILTFIKDAILKPLAALAEGTDGYDLLRAVLGEDPITGEPYPPTPENLIGGFMKFIGQEEIWTNIQQSGAIPRAWAWFQGAMATVKGFVMQIPGLFIQVLQSLELIDVVLVPRAFAKVIGVFGSFVGSFISWAGSAMWELLKIIFAVVAPGVLVYLERAGGAFQTILQDPIGFIGNLVRAGKRGFEAFAGNFFGHLQDALVSWLTGSLEGAGVYIPSSLEFQELLKFALSVLGVTWDNVRVKLVNAIGEPAVKALEEGFELVKTLVVEGPAAAWEQFLEKLSNFGSMLISEIVSFVTQKIVQTAVAKIVTSLNPVGGFIQAIITIYQTISFLINRLSEIGQVVARIIDSIAEIASGNIGPAALKVEGTLKGLLTLAVKFLAKFAGLGRVSDAIMNVLRKIREPVDQALDKVIDWIMSKGKRFLKGKADEKHGQIATQAVADMETGGEAATSYEALRALKETQARQVEQKYQGQLEGDIKIRIVFTAVAADKEDQDLDFEVIIAPNTTKKAGSQAISAANQADPGITNGSKIKRLADGKFFTVKSITDGPNGKVAATDMMLSGGVRRRGDFEFKYSDHPGLWTKATEQELKDAGLINKHDSKDVDQQTGTVLLPQYRGMIRDRYYPNNSAAGLYTLRDNRTGGALADPQNANHFLSEAPFTQEQRFYPSLANKRVLPNGVIKASIPIADAGVDHDTPVSTNWNNTGSGGSNMDQPARANWYKQPGNIKIISQRLNSSKGGESYNVQVGPNFRGPDD